MRTLRDLLEQNRQIETDVNLNSEQTTTASIGAYPVPIGGVLRDTFPQPSEIEPYIEPDEDDEPPFRRRKRKRLVLKRSKKTTSRY